MARPCQRCVSDVTPAGTLELQRLVSQAALRQRLVCALLIGGLCLPASACWSVGWIRVTAPLTATDDCLSGALHASPYVAFAWRDQAAWYHLTFHDSVLAQPGSQASVSPAHQDTPGKLYIEFVWRGRLSASSAPRRRQLGNLGAELLAEVQARCGLPVAPVEPDCEEGRWGHWPGRPCA